MDEIPFSFEHLIVQVSPDSFQCGDAPFVERSYAKDLCASLLQVEEIHFTPSGDTKLSVRLKDGLTPPLKAYLCVRCRDMLLWHQIGKLKSRVDSLESRLRRLESSNRGLDA